MSNKPRHWPRFTLRTLLLSIAIISLPLAIASNRVHRQRAAIAVITTAGGTIRYDYQRHVDVAINDPSGGPPGPKWIRKIVGDDWFRRIEQVSFDETALPPVNVSYDAILESMEGLTSVRIFTPRSVGTYGGTTGRSEFSIPLTDKGLEFAGTLSGLINLSLNATRISDQGVSQLAKLSHLLVLDLSATDVGDNGIYFLRNMQSLQSLNLRCSLVTDGGLQYVANLKTLESLDIGSTRITDTGLKHLLTLQRLRILRLDWNQEITDKGLEVLRNLPNLEQIYLSRTNVTDAGCDELIKKIPKLLIRR